jgi:hypothetical protein
MITPILERPVVLPDVARLGFDYGWLLLPPTFLNLHLPVLIVDHAYVGDPGRFGLEQFGACDPRASLPRGDLAIRSFGDLIIVRSKSTSDVIATTCLPGSTPVLAAYLSAVLITGSTYELQSTWAALWAMSIGRADITNSEERHEHA